MRRLLAGAAVAAAVLAVATPAGAIVYGEPTDDHDDVAAVVAVFTTDEGPEEYVWCTGTLIDPDTVLSAAHCFPTWEEIESSMHPRFDDVDYAVAFSVDRQLPLDDDGTVAAAALLAGQEHIHPAFPGPASDLRDVAVFQLDADATERVADMGIQPAEVAPIGYVKNSVHRSDTFTTVGYGAVRDTRTRAWQPLEDAEGERHVAEQPMLSLTGAWLTLSMNDARSHGGTCYGDSGGPHFHGDDRVLVSLTVTGDTNCKATDKTYRVDTPLVHDFLEPYWPGVSDGD